MVLRDFRCVSARAAYRGVKNVDLHPLFLLWREEGFLYYVRIYSFRQKIYKEEMTHG